MDEADAYESLKQAAEKKIDDLETAFSQTGQTLQEVEIEIGRMKTMKASDSGQPVDQKQKRSQSPAMQRIHDSVQQRGQQGGVGTQGIFSGLPLLSHLVLECVFCLVSRLVVSDFDRVGLDCYFCPVVFDLG